MTSIPESNALRAPPVTRIRSSVSPKQKAKADDDDDSDFLLFPSEMVSKGSVPVAEERAASSENINR
jgi:hypothetical protein